MDYPSYEQGRHQGRPETQGGGDGCGLLLLILAALICVWACLYPLSAFAGAAAWFAAHAALEPLGSTMKGFNRTLVLFIIPSCISLAALWSVSRLDHRLAGNALYRIMRHAVRLVMIATAVSLIHLQLQDHVSPLDLYCWTGFQPLSMERKAAVWFSVITADPVRVWLAIGAAAVSHLWLFHGKWGRNAWNGTLEALKLRPAGVLN